MKKIVLSMAILLAMTLGLYAQNSITDPFFDHVPYAGAFGQQDDWTTGWANWTPQNTGYPAATEVISGEINQNTTWTAGSSPLLNKAAFTNTNLTDAFFEKVSYIGAFGSTDWTAGWANWTPQNTVYPATNVTISGEITQSTTWTANNTYLLQGFVYVNDGVTLTIEPGTIIRGDKDSKGSLIIRRGAKLIAEGTAEKPIVFTSNQSEGNRNYGDWGGVILCGKATINQSGGEAIIEGGPDATYGGGTSPDDADNSGSLKYVRIEFPGIAFVPDKEINGLTFGGVGTGTSVEYIQVSYSGDDSYEWFGGKVNVKHLIAFRGWDDDFDTDNGFSGKAQFCVALRDPEIADPGSGSNSFESDNDANGSSNTPVTHAIFSNISIFGPKVNGTTSINTNFKRSMHLRRNTKLCIYNSVISGFPTGLFIDGSASQANATSNELQIENSILSGMGTFFASDFERTYFTDASRHNDTIVDNTGLLVKDPFNLSAPDFLPMTSSKAYLLQGFVYVNDGVTLTIEPGTIIRGDKDSKGSLIIRRGGKLIAEGTVDNPIIFTSNQSEGNRNYGDWGGVILCGKATINQSGGEAIIEGGTDATYGGGTSPDDADNSGSLKYVRIEFPGIAFVPDKEINGLTFGGVGTGTSVEYIQVSYSGDDSYEWFGGKVNVKHLIAFRGWDDDFDTDNGFGGMLQFCVALRDPEIADPGSGSNGFESDNDANGSSNTPVTSPVFSNISIFGPKVDAATSINTNFKRAMHLRRNTQLKVYNSIFTGFPTGLFIDGSAAQANATAGDLVVKNTVISGMGTFFASDFERNYFKTSDLKNDTLVNNSYLYIADPFNLESPDFRPLSESPVINKSIWSSDGINELKKYGLSINFYPNPVDASGNFTLEMEKTGRVLISLYNMNGKMIQRISDKMMSQGVNNISVNLSDLPSGIYVATCTSDKGTQMIKIIKE